MSDVEFDKKKGRLIKKRRPYGKAIFIRDPFTGFMKRMIVPRDTWYQMQKEKECSKK